MAIQLHIEADNADDLMSVMAKLSGGAASDAPKATRTRASKADGAAPATPGAGAELPAAAALPPMTGAAPDPDLMGSPPPAAAAAPAAMNLDQFLAAVKALLGKGKDDAIRNKVAEMGFARVRDVPPDKFADVLKTVSAL